MSRRNNNIALATLSAALLAGCGGGGPADGGSVVMLTDRPAAAMALVAAMPDHDVHVHVQETPAASAAAAVAAWATRGARMVVAHYTPGTVQSVCQEAKRLHIGCIVTDPIDPADLDASQAGAITYSGETYCDLDWLDSAEAQGKFLAQCMAGQRGIL